MTRTAFDGRTWENHIQKNVRWHWYGVWLGIGPKPLGILALGCPATSWLLVAFPEILAKLGFIIPYNHAETTTAVSPKRSSDASSMLNIVKPHLFVTNKFKHFTARNQWFFSPWRSSWPIPSISVLGDPLWMWNFLKMKMNLLNGHGDLKSNEDLKKSG